MAKIFGSVAKNDRKRPENKHPDLRGSIKIGGYQGDNAELRNTEAATWLRNLAKEFSEEQVTYISIALWKRVDEDTGAPYLSVCLEDNSWKSQNQPASNGQSQKTASPASTEKTDPKPDSPADDFVF